MPPTAIDAGRGAARSALVGILLVGALVGVWVLGSATAAGPDEPSHLVRAAGLVRGQVGGEETPDGGAFRLYDVPGWIAAEDPSCYAFDPLEPAGCATGIDSPNGDQELPSRSRQYPIWGHLAPGVATLLPSSVAPWTARLLDGLIPAILIGTALAVRARDGWLSVGSTLLAVTPMAWFLFAVVNPSGLVIAGGVGLWVGLLAAERGPPGVPRWMIRWLIAASWAAMALPRRDGLIWAMAIVSIVILITETRLSDWWRHLGTGPTVVVGVSTVVMLVWALRSESTGATALLLTPLLPIIADWAGRSWRARSRISTGWQFAVLGVLALIVMAGTYIVMNRRPGGFDASILNAIVGQTGIYLEHHVGDLGWLDTPLPRSAVFVWFIAVGLVAAPAIENQRARLLAGAGLTVGFALWASWTLSMVVSDEHGAYWQGRYYTPLLVGVPILLGAARVSGGGPARLGRVAALVALGVNFAAYGAAMRRWAVGIEGTYFPWRWDTYGSPLPPIVLLALALVVSWGIWRWLASACDVQAATGDAVMASS